MPTVFVPQVPSRQIDGNWMPQVDLSAAGKFGRVEIMLPPGANRLLVTQMYEVVREKLRDFGPEDWILALGDPSIYAAAACYATKRNNGTLRLLKWDRKTSDYLPMELVI